VPGVANNKRKGTGRVTPRKAASAGPGATASGARPGGPAKPAVGQVGKKPVGQVGKKPSSPLMLFAIGLAWVVVGVIVLFTFHASWRIIPGVFAFGVGAFFIRGASTTVARHERRR